MKNLDWYHSLTKPALAPPDGVFGPVWTVLYLMIFLSFVFFLKADASNHKLLPLSLFVVQMVLNFLWSPIFFGAHKIKLAFVVICLMWIFILGTIITFYPFSKTASLLLVPYFLWVSFAMYLNFEFMRLNNC